MKAGELLGEHKKMKDKVKRLEKEVKHLEKHKNHHSLVSMETKVFQFGLFRAMNTHIKPERVTARLRPFPHYTEGI